MRQGEERSARGKRLSGGWGGRNDRAAVLIGYPLVHMVLTMTTTTDQGSGEEVMTIQDLVSSKIKKTGRRSKDQEHVRMKEGDVTHFKEESVGKALLTEPWGEMRRKGLRHTKCCMERVEQGDLLRKEEMEQKMAKLKELVS